MISKIRYLAAYGKHLPNNWLGTELIAASQLSERANLAGHAHAVRQEEAVWGLARPAGIAVTCPLNLTFMYTPVTVVYYL